MHSFGTEKKILCLAQSIHLFRLHVNGAQQVPCTVSVELLPAVKVASSCHFFSRLLIAVLLQLLPFHTSVNWSYITKKTAGLEKVDHTCIVYALNWYANNQIMLYTYHAVFLLILYACKQSTQYILHLINRVYSIIIWVYVVRMDGEFSRLKLRKIRIS